jgi:nitrilase
MIGKRYTAAAAQLTSTADVSGNLTTCARLAAEAAAKGAELLILPENFAFLGSSDRDKLAVAEEIDAAGPGSAAARPGPIVAALQGIARAHRMWVVGGGMPERLADDAGRTHNTAVVVAPDGALHAVYRKLHLFDVAIPGKAEHRESASTAPGRDVITADTPLGTLGVSICYDLRFPELYRTLALAGADLLLVPAAFTAFTGAAHWHSLLRARAIENQCYVIAAAQSGRHNERRQTYGHSMIIDPWGAVLAELPSGVGVITAEIDPDRLAETRAQMPCLSHRVL